MPNWSREDLAWMAALYEGEGCLQTKPFRLKFKMTDRDVLEAFAERTGYDIVVGGPYKPSGLGVKDTYDYNITGRKAYALVVAMWPWMLSRRRQQITEAVKWWLAQPRYRKLVPSDVETIKSELRSPYWGQTKALAERFGVTNGMISSIKVGRTWAHVA